MTKHMWIALLIMIVPPLIILFLCREPIINNIKLFFEDKEPIEELDSTYPYFRMYYVEDDYDISPDLRDFIDSLAMDNRRKSLIKDMEYLSKKFMDSIRNEMFKTNPEIIIDSICIMFNNGYKYCTKIDTFDFTSYYGGNLNNSNEYIRSDYVPIQWNHIRR